MDTNKISAIASVIAIISCKMKQEGLNYDMENLIKPELIIEILKKLNYNDITCEDIDSVTQDVFCCKGWTETKEFEGVVFQGNVIEFIFKSLDTLKLNQYLLKSGHPSTRPNQDVVNYENHQ